MFQLMDKIKLKQKQIMFLLNNLSNKELKLKLDNALENAKKNQSTNRILISFSNNEKTIMLDELTYLLTSIGLDDEETINQQGLIIEDIIDLFTIYKS